MNQSNPIEELKDRFFGDVIGLLRREGIARWDPASRVLTFEGQLTEERLQHLKERM